MSAEFRGTRYYVAWRTKPKGRLNFLSAAKNAQSVEMAPDETFWAERFAMFTDRYGTPWMLNYEGAKSQT